MANCNCNDFPISCAPHAPGGDCCHPHGCPPHPHPCPPPPFKGGTSMYIGARYVPIFADPVEWDDEREYEPLTIVVHNGDCYTSKCYVPKGAQLPPYPEGQTKYWVKTSDYNYQFADLKKTVTDLSRLVEQFQKDNERFTELINGWNEKVIQWEKDMAAWGERLDAVESNVADLTASLNAEIDRAKAAEQANTAAIAQETADRKQAVSDLDAAYKAADAAEAQARAEADTALSNRITTNTTDIDAIKAEQVIQNTNISNNAKNIADNSAEIAKHAARLTDLESNASDWDSVFPDTTIAQEVQKEEEARANGDTALNGRCDAIAGEIARLETDKADKSEIPDVSGFVTTETYTQGQAAQDAKIDANTAALAGKADKGEIPDVSGLLSKTEAEETYQPKGEYALKSEIPNVSNFVTTSVYNEGQQAQDAKITEAKAAADKATVSIGDWDAQHPGQTIAQAMTDVSGSIPDVSEFVTNAKRGEVFPIFLNMHTASDYYMPSGTFNGSTIAFLIPTSKFFQDRTLLNLCDRYGTKQEGRPYTYSINKSDGVIYTDVTIDPGYHLRPLGPAALLELFPSLSTSQKLKPGEPITLQELKMVDTDLFISVENITEPES